MMLRDDNEYGGAHDFLRVLKTHSVQHTGTAIKAGG